jgi:membrane associated rhomboid family serine protease
MTLILVILTALVSILAFSNKATMSKLILNPWMVHHRNEYWRLISSGFIHADWMHLLVNLFVLFGFGQSVEMYYGYYFGEQSTYYYLLLYLAAILIANAPSLAKHKNNQYYNSLGASGAVSAVLFAAILFAPWSKVYLFGVIGVPGIILGPLYLLMEYRMGQKGGSNINHDAHFWGAIFGMVFTIALKPAIFLDFIGQLTNFTF